MARLCPEAIRSIRFPFIIAQLQSSAVTAMSTSVRQTVIPDSNSDSKPYYYSDVDGKPYYYSNINKVHKPSEPSLKPSSEPSLRKGLVQHLRNALNAVSVIPLNRVDIAFKLLLFSKTNSNSNNSSKSK